MILILENPEIKDMINGFLAELEYDYQADRDSPIDVSDEFRQNDYKDSFQYNRLLKLILADCGLPYYRLIAEDGNELDVITGIFSGVEDLSKVASRSTITKTLDEILGDAFILMLSRINKIAIGPNYETLWIYFKD